MSFIKHNIIFIIIGVALIGGGVWFALSSSAPAAPTLVTTSSTDGADQQLVSTLLALRAVSLDGTIFTDPGFLSLQDFTTQIVSEPVGRDDPFAPLSAETLSATSSTNGEELFTPKNQ